MSTAVRKHLKPAWSPFFAIGLVLIVALAAGLRLWSIDFGLPLVTHPDEPLIVDAARRMVAERTLDPSWFRYPAFIINIEAAIVAAVAALARVITLSSDQLTTLHYLLGRLVMALFGIATVALAGDAGRRVSAMTRDNDPADRIDDLAGLLAAGLLAVSFIHVKDSHFLKPDVPTGFFTLLTLWFALDGLQTGRTDRVRPWVLAGVAVGLAGASKYTGAVVAMVPAMALLLIWLERRDGLRSYLRVLVLMGVTAGVVFLLVNPYALLTPGEFLSPVDGIRAELEHYRTGHDGAEGSDSWRWYLGETWRNGFGPTLTPLVMLGALACLWRLRRGRQVLWLVLAFVPVYYLMIARYPVRFDRQLIPLLPYLAVLGGVGLAVLLGWALARRTHLLRPALAITLLAGALLALPQTIDAGRWNHLQGQPDTRYAARDWIRANIPPGTIIVREWHTPPLAPDGYGDVFIRAAYDQPYAWFEASGAEYLLLSSYMYARYLDAPQQYPAEAAFYERLLARPHVADFTGRNGPELVILRVDQIADAFRE